MPDENTTPTPKPRGRPKGPSKVGTPKPSTTKKRKNGKDSSVEAIGACIGALNKLSTKERIRSLKVVASYYEDAEQ